MQQFTERTVSVTLTSLLLRTLSRLPECHRLDRERGRRVPLPGGDGADVGERPRFQRLIGVCRTPLLW